jgi:hypothetical protein
MSRARPSKEHSILRISAIPLSSCYEPGSRDRDHQDYQDNERYLSSIESPSQYDFRDHENQNTCQYCDEESTH